MDTLGRRIKFARGKTSQEAFAKSLQISKGSLGFYERDENLPNSDVILKICSITGVSLVWLMTGTGPEKTEGMPTKHDGTARHNGSTRYGACPRCLELYAKLVQAQEREIGLLKENRALEAEISALQTRTSPSTDSAASLEKSA